MRLARWIKLRGYGEKSRLARATGLSYQTILEISKGRRAEYESAKLISLATGGAVSIDELCGTRKRAS